MVGQGPPIKSRKRGAFESWKGEGGGGEGFPKLADVYHLPPIALLALYVAIIILSAVKYAQQQQLLSLSHGLIASRLSNHRAMRLYIG